MEKLIWQPSITNRYDFTISLDKTFARKMLEARITSERGNRLNEIGKEDLRELGISHRSPYLFYEQSAFVKQISLGNGGVWLATNANELRSVLEDPEDSPVKYYSHNVSSSKDAYVLMALFDRWVDLANAFKKV